MCRSRRDSCSSLLLARDCRRGLRLIQQLRVKDVGYLVGCEDEESLAVGAECPCGDVIGKSQKGALFERLQIVDVDLSGFILDKQDARRGGNHRIGSKEDRFLLTG